MNRLIAMLREVAGLFFDDGHLALTVVVILGATALLQRATPFGGPASAALLVAGVVAALLSNVIRTARAARAKE